MSCIASGYKIILLIFQPYAADKTSITPWTLYKVLLISRTKAIVPKIPLWCRSFHLRANSALVVVLTQDSSSF